MYHKKINSMSHHRSFKDYCQQITKQELCQKLYLQQLQQQIADEVHLYMNEENIGFNELVRRLDMSPTKVSNIKKKKANLTLASVARLFALLNREPHFKTRLD